MSHDQVLSQGAVEVGSIGPGAQSASPDEQNVRATSPIDLSDSLGMARQLFVEQFVSLRSEIEQRVNLRQQLNILTLVITGTLLTIGVQTNTSWVVLLFYPLLAMFIAAAWEHNDLRIGQINWFIQSEVEQRLGLAEVGWETFRRQTFQGQHKRAKLRGGRRGELSVNTPASELQSSPVLIEVSARGLFLTTQTLTQCVAVARFALQWASNQTLSTLLQSLRFSLTTAQQASLDGFALVVILNLAVIVYTGFLLRHRRVRSMRGEKATPMG